MKNLVVVCLVLSLAPAVFAYPPSSEAFTLANCVGEPNARSFFMFSTSAGNYTIRHDGMGEFTSPRGMRRVFKLRMGARSRLDRVYFLEHEGDLFLLYEVRNQLSYLVRMEQKKRKARWLTPLPDISAFDQDPIINGDVVIIAETIVINKADGRVVNAAEPK